MPQVLSMCQQKEIAKLILFSVYGSCARCASLGTNRPHRVTSYNSKSSRLVSRNFMYCPRRLRDYTIRHLAASAREKRRNSDWNWNGCYNQNGLMMVSSADVVGNTYVKKVSRMLRRHIMVKLWHWLPRRLWEGYILLLCSPWCNYRLCELAIWLGQC